MERSEILTAQDVLRLESTIRCKYAPYQERKRAFDALCDLGVMTDELTCEYHQISRTQSLDGRMIHLANKARVLIVEWIHMDVRDRRNLPPLEEWILGQEIADVQSDNGIVIDVNGAMTYLMQCEVAIEQVYQVLDYSFTIKRRGAKLVIDRLVRRCV